MMLPYFLCTKQKVYWWVCIRNIENGGNKISHGGGGGSVKLKMTPNAVSNYLFAEAGEGVC